MMQGSGPADRDNDVLFPPIREALLNRGIACFSFDKPGVGTSTGDWRRYALEDRVEQATAALDVLRAHPRIDGRKVGVFGHSQGGWLAQMLAGRAIDLAFAIASSGPSIGIEAQDLYGCEHRMRALGRSEDEIAAALGFLQALHEAARHGVEYETVEARLLESARGQAWYGYLTVDDAGDWELMRAVISEGYEPLEALSRVSCPFLATYGGLDTLLPAWQCAREAGESLGATGNDDFVVAVFPRGDHRMQVSGGFVPGYLDLIADWSRHRV